MSGEPSRIFEPAKLLGEGDMCHVIDAWVGASIVLTGLVQFAARFEGADPEWRVDGAQ